MKAKKNGWKAALHGEITELISLDEFRKMAEEYGKKTRPPGPPERPR